MISLIKVFHLQRGELLFKIKGQTHFRNIKIEVRIVVNIVKVIKMERVNIVRARIVRVVINNKENIYKRMIRINKNKSKQYKISKKLLIRK